MTEDQTVAEMIAVEEGNGGRTRHAAIAGLTALALGGIMLVPAPSPARASITVEEFTAEDTKLTSHHGSIHRLLIDPVLAVEWEGLNEDSSTLTLEITFDTDEEEAITPYDLEKELDGVVGDTQFDLDQIDLLEEGWGAETFISEDRGEAAESTVSVTWEWEIDDGGDDPALEGTESDSFTVTVENHPSQGGVGGNVETTAESDNEVGN